MIAVTLRLYLRLFFDERILSTHSVFQPNLIHSQPSVSSLLVITHLFLDRFHRYRYYQVKYIVENRRHNKRNKCGL